MGAYVFARSVWAGLAVAAALANTALSAETKIGFTLDGPIDGTAAPYVLALDKGYYKAEQLNVTVKESASSLEAVNRVASGAYDIGVADINVLIRFRDANPKQPVKAIFVVYNRPPFAVIGRRSRGISDPSSLTGKKIGAPTADPATAQWPIFTKVNGIDPSKVTLENVGPPVRNPMLAAGEVDAILGQSFISYVNLKARGVPLDDLVLMLMADYGVELYGNAIIVNPKFAATNPDAVKAFLRAFLRGLQKTVGSPTTAIEAVMKRDERANKAIELERLMMAIHDNIVTPEVRANGFGGIDQARFSRAIDQLALAARFKEAKPKPDDIFDAAYLPPSDQRQLKSKR